MMEISEQKMYDECVRTCESISRDHPDLPLLQKGDRTLTAKDILREVKDKTEFGLRFFETWAKNRRLK